jgi:hypothetical protein
LPGGCDNAAASDSENSDSDHFFCVPAGSDLTDVFEQAAIELASPPTLTE